MIQTATEIYALRVSRVNVNFHTQNTKFNKCRTPNRRTRPVSGDWIVRTRVQTFIVDNEGVVQEFVSTGCVNSLYSDTEFRRRFSRTTQRSERGTYLIIAK